MRCKVSYIFISIFFEFALCECLGYLPIVYPFTSVLAAVITTLLSKCIFLFSSRYCLVSLVSIDRIQSLFNLSLQLTVRGTWKGP